MQVSTYLRMCGLIKTVVHFKWVRLKIVSLAYLNGQINSYLLLTVYIVYIVVVVWSYKSYGFYKLSIIVCEIQKYRQQKC